MWPPPSLGLEPTKDCEWVCRLFQAKVHFPNIFQWRHCLISGNLIFKDTVPHYLFFNRTFKNHRGTFSGKSGHQWKLVGRHKFSYCGLHKLTICKISATWKWKIDSLQFSFYNSKPQWQKLKHTKMAKFLILPLYHDQSRAFSIRIQVEELRNLRSRSLVKVDTIL